VDGVFLLLREKENFDHPLAMGSVAPPPVPKKETLKERVAKELAAAKQRIKNLERKLMEHNLPIPEEEADEQEVSRPVTENMAQEEPDTQPPGEPVLPVDEPENPGPDSEPPSEPKAGTPDDDGEPEGPAEPAPSGPQA
jgi:hypothetical protein